MISVSFHKKLSSTLSQKIDSFCQTQDNVGLHQVLAFTKGMEPQKQVEYCIVENENCEIQGFCVIHLHFPIAFIQDGPISKDEIIVSTIISTIQKRFKKRFYAFTTIQLPYLVQAKLKCNNAIVKYFDLPTWATIIVDLSNTESLFKTFSKGHPSAIKKAEKSGINISNTFTEQTIKDFALLFDKMYKKRKIIPQWKDSELYFKKISEMMKSNNSFFTGAYLEEKLVAGGIFLAYGKTVHYKFGCSDHELRTIPLMHSVIYNAMLHSKDKGFTSFDLAGINLVAPEDSQIQGINTFKKGFGGKIIKSPKRIYVTNNSVSLAIVLFLLKLKKLLADNVWHSRILSV